MFLDMKGVRKLTLNYIFIPNLISKFTPKCGRTARASPPVLLLPVIFQSVLNPSIRIREVAEYKSQILGVIGPFLENGGPKCTNVCFSSVHKNQRPCNTSFYIFFGMQNPFPIPVFTKNVIEWLFLTFFSRVQLQIKKTGKYFEKMCI